MEAPLAGIRVIEIASYVAAPAAGALLVDFGAEVVKVEVPHGEFMRYSAPRHHGFRDRDFLEAPAFQMDNRGKRSLAIDLGKPDAREALRRLIAGADVVLTNMLPNRLERHGFDARTLRADHPELIVATVSGYGPVGDAANDPAFDYTAFWARTGLMDQLAPHRLIWAPVQTLAEAVRDPAARASGAFQMSKHSEAGEFETVSPPLRMSGHDLRSDRVDRISVPTTMRCCAKRVSMKRRFAHWSSPNRANAAPSLRSEVNEADRAIAATKWPAASRRPAGRAA